jgi:hypothetical protein
MLITLHLLHNEAQTATMVGPPARGVTGGLSFGAVSRFAKSRELISSSRSGPTLR